MQNAQLGSTFQQVLRCSRQLNRGGVSCSKRCTCFAASVMSVVSPRSARQIVAIGEVVSLPVVVLASFLVSPAAKFRDIVSVDRNQDVKGPGPLQAWR